MAVAALAGFSGEAMAAVNLKTASGWLESAYIEWELQNNAASYNVYVQEVGGTATKIDNELVRDYGTYGRADVVGIKAGQYTLSVVPVDANGAELTDEKTTSDVLNVAAYDRSGYAHFNYNDGIGAYNNDGTLKTGAKVLYVYAGNAKTITCDVINSSKGTSQTFTGLQAIIGAYEKGLDTTPLDVRILGTITDSDMDAFGSSAEGLQIKGKKNTTPMNITIEGIGNDATIWGFGMLLRNALSVELRNFAVMLCMDDCISVDTDNSHLWIHNLDLFYGKAGSASDQAKGDGTVDIKSDSQNITVSYCHFWDSGKSSLCGMKSESGPNWITYHHNWFDHSDSRHPRIRTMSVHVYNNYFDGNSKYGIGATLGANAFVENNYFRNCKYPMMISKQGSDNLDPDGNGTFSGEAGGMIKSFGNVMITPKSYIKHTDSATSFDAYEATTRDELVPDTYKTVSGSYTYSNFDTDATNFYLNNYICDEAADVPSIVTGDLGAGRIAHGDFQWTFNNSTEDSNYSVIAGLKTALQNYKSSLKGFFGASFDNSDNNGEDNGDNNGDENGEENGDDNSDNNGDDNSDTPAVEGSSMICVFTGMKPSNTDFFTISGNCSNSKGTATVDGVTYTECLKMESATSIAFTTTKAAKLKVVFADSETVSIKINGTKYKSSDLATESNVLLTAIEAGSYELTKGDSRNVFYIGVFYDETENGDDNSTTGVENIIFNNAQTETIYDLQGRKIRTITNPGLYIINGKKVIVK
jgi:pectate lyase